MKRVIKESMQNIKSALLVLFRSKRFKTFCWQTLNGLLAVVIASSSEISYLNIPWLIALLNMITKYINITYIQ